MVGEGRKIAVKMRKKDNRRAVIETVRIESKKYNDNKRNETSKGKRRGNVGIKIILE